MRWIIGVWVFVTMGCDDAAPSTEPPAPPCEALAETCTVDESATCGRLFGLPSERTGLPLGQCAPDCACGDATWTPLAWDAEFLEQLRSYVLLNPPERLLTDPYADPDAYPQRPQAACGAHFQAEGYRLETYDSPAAARAAGAVVSHYGACGLCSSLQDLAIYVGIPDLTEPVRACGIKGIAEGEDAQRECLLDIGFTPPCADIWAYNTSHTRQACGAVCLPLLNAPYHTEDGSPNACISCDETESGPVFKAVSGRTRRNSGLPTALCRPCETVAPIEHVYP
jgi:hypothetical protein